MTDEKPRLSLRTEAELEIASSVRKFIEDKFHQSKNKIILFFDSGH
jgi:hypothetical protein